MTSLFLKTIMRVLIIFVPVISLSYAKDIYAQQPENIVIIGLGIMVILCIILVFIWWDRKKRIARSHTASNIVPMPGTAKKHR